MAATNRPWFRRKTRTALAVVSLLGYCLAASGLPVPVERGKGLRPCGCLVRRKKRGHTESLFHQPLSPEWGGIIEPGA